MTGLAKPTGCIPGNTVPRSTGVKALDSGYDTLSQMLTFTPQNGERTQNHPTQPPGTHKLTISDQER